MLSSEGFPSGATVGYAKSQVRDILKGEFNKSVELQVILLLIFIYKVISCNVLAFFWQLRTYNGNIGTI